MTDKELSDWEHHIKANVGRRERYQQTTDLREATWLWREMLRLYTLDDCAERLGQEASLFLVTLDMAHEDNDTCECHRCTRDALDEGRDDGSLHAGF